ncbi:MAG: hypothetical protein H6828_03935 [Planctomycetes bacterium]|nr:hypothetical protein [Planctomycetota bacterium]
MSDESNPARMSLLQRFTTPKSLITMFITLILVVGEARYGALGGFHKLVITLGTCVLTELALGFFVRGVMPPLQSAYITGMSLSLLLRPVDGQDWLYAAAAMLSIGSKYALRYRGKHLWNPSNFGLAAMVLLDSRQVGLLSHEMGNDLRVNAIIWLVGLMVASRARVLHVTLTYATSFTAFAALRAAILPATSFATEVAPLTGPMYQLLCFFMLTDPPTTPGTAKKRIVSTVIIAALECVFRLANEWHWPGATLVAPAPAIIALFLVGPITFGLDLRARGRATAAPGGAVPSPA